MTISSRIKRARRTIKYLKSKVALANLLGRKKEKAAFTQTLRKEIDELKAVREFLR